MHLTPAKYLVVFFLALFLFHSCSEEDRTIHIRCDQVNGLNERAAVLLNGVESGNVTKIQMLPDHTFLVSIAVNGYLRLTRSSVFYIAGSDLFGSRVIDVRTDTSLHNTIVIESGDTVSGIYEKALQQKVMNLLDNVADTTKK